MKRARAKSGATNRGGDDESSFFSNKPKEVEKTWAEHTEGKDETHYVLYSMEHRFTKGMLLVHPKFGKGVVIGVEPQRIEVLFEDGTKKLGHA